MQPMIMALANEVERQRQNERRMRHMRSEAIAGRNRRAIGQAAVSWFPRGLMPARVSGCNGPVQY